MTVILSYNELIRTCLTRTAAGLAVLCALSAFLYGTFLLLAVAHVAARTDAQTSIERLSMQVSDLEAQYLSETKTLTLERAKELGFTDPVSVTTVYATGPARALSLRTGN